MDRYAIGLLLLIFFAGLGFIIRQECINQELRQTNALYRVQIEDLSRRQRLTAQDVDFIEKLVIEGKQ